MNFCTKCGTPLVNGSCPKCSRGGFGYVGVQNGAGNRFGSYGTRSDIERYIPAAVCILMALHCLINFLYGCFTNYYSDTKSFIIALPMMLSAALCVYALIMLVKRNPACIKNTQNEDLRSRLFAAALQALLAIYALSCIFTRFFAVMYSDAFYFVFIFVYSCRVTARGSADRLRTLSGTISLGVVAVTAFLIVVDMFAYSDAHFGWFSLTTNVIFTVFFAFQTYVEFSTAGRV